MAFGGQRPRTTAVIPEASPFVRARQVWAERDGDGRAQARNWRIMAFAMTTIAMIFASAFVYEATRIKIAAYYVPISDLGRPGRITLIGDQYTPGRGEISYFLQNWVKTMFEKSIDPVTQGSQLKTNFSFLRGNALTTMTEWAQVNDPMKDLGHVARTVTINSILQRSEQIWQVNWTETTYTDGAKSKEDRYSGLFVLDHAPPQTEVDMNANPLGLHITNISMGLEGVTQ
jgi:type IV secretory pathway TrbF-like protein